MNKDDYKLFSFLFASIAMLPTAVNAFCTASNPMILTPSSTLNYSGQADGVMVGNQIGSGWGGTTSQPRTFAGCVTKDRQIAYAKPRDIATGVQFTSNGVTYPVYPTGVQGIGYIIGVKDTNAVIYTPISAPQTQTFPVNGVNPAPQDSIGFSAQVIYVATGTLKAGSYSVPTKVIADLFLHNERTGDYEVTPTYMQLNGINVNVVATSCIINQSNINVDLDTVLGSSLTAIGMTAKPKDFSIGLQCDTGTRINVKLTGTKNSEANNDSVLQLDNAGGSDVASGVGMQILYNNTPMILDGNIILKTSSGGPETFPFTVRYYQTKSVITSGTANATAILEVAYR